MDRKMLAASGDVWELGGNRIDWLVDVYRGDYIKASNVLINGVAPKGGSPISDEFKSFFCEVADGWTNFDRKEGVKVTHGRL